MKIALCLSGQPRFIEETFQNIKSNLLDKYDVDLFVHTWYDSIPNPYNTTPHLIYEKEQLEDCIKELYKPVSFKIEKQKTFNTKEIDVVDTVARWGPAYNSEDGHKYWINMQRCMWYSIMMSNLLKETYRLENNVEYEYVIKWRFDLQLNSVLDLNQLDPNKLYSITHAGHTPTDHITDWAFFSSNNNMNILTSIFLHMKRLSLGMRQDYLANEMYLKKQADDHNIPVEYLLLTNGVRR